MKHHCCVCNYGTDRKEYFEKHILTKKHQKNILNETDNNKDKDKDLCGNIMLTVVKNQEELAKQNEELKREIIELKRINNFNTNKIVKEAREVKKSILTILNTKFRDTPSIDYIKEDEFINELQLEYKSKVDIDDDTLFMRIFRDYEKKILHQTIANIILKIIIKDDKKKQAVFNIDYARGNFATKTDDYWMNDKKGFELKKYTLKVAIEYMIKILDVFRQRLYIITEKNKKNTDPELMDYFILNQKRMYDVSSFITNPSTHSKILMLLCPELRFDEKMLFR
jgi:hypothetical protein